MQRPNRLKTSEKSKINIAQRNNSCLLELSINPIDVKPLTKKLAPAIAITGVPRVTTQINKQLTIRVYHQKLAVQNTRSHLHEDIFFLRPQK